MDKTWKKKWIKALTSGEYKQCKGVLREDTNRPDAYCCLGVLCDIINPKVWVVNKRFYSYLGSDGTLPEKIRIKTNITLQNQGKLTEMNDIDKSNFTKIAAWIDKNL